MPWNDEKFRQIVEESARRVGKTRTQVLIESGIARSTLNQVPRHGRSVDLIERLMPALGWGPEDALAIISMSFGWGATVKAADTKKGLRTTLESIAAAAKRLGSTLPSDESVANLEDALALVGAMVRAQEDWEGKRQTEG